MTKNKPHPSFVRLLNSAKKIGFEGHSALAKSLSQSEQTITNWAARGVSKQGAILAQEHFQLSPKWIIDGVGDEKIGPEPSNVKPAPQRTEVAIISWVAAGKLTEIVDYWDEDLGSVTPSKSKPGKRAFALIVEGYSMTDTAPGARSFPPGTRLIVDPDMGWGPNDFVIAKDVRTQQATFKQLVTESGRWYLRPLNNNSGFHTVEIDDPSLIVIGRVCESMPESVKL